MKNRFHIKTIIFILFLKGSLFSMDNKNHNNESKFLIIKDTPEFKKIIEAKIPHYFKNTKEENLIEIKEKNGVIALIIKDNKLLTPILDVVQQFNGNNNDNNNSNTNVNIKIIQIIGNINEIRFQKIIFQYNTNNNFNKL